MHFVKISLIRDEFPLWSSDFFSEGCSGDFLKSADVINSADNDY